MNEALHKIRTSLKSTERDRIVRMAENEDIDIDNPDDAVNEETDDNNDITEFELGTANIPGIKRELKRLYALHPELIIDYKETLKNRIPLSVIQPSTSNSDPLHTTYPFVTLFEKTKIIGNSRKSHCGQCRIGRLY